MDLFVLAFLLLTASVSALTFSDNNSVRHAESTTSDSSFLEIIRTNDMCVRDAIYYTPAVAFVGTANKLLRCLYEEPSECEVMSSSWTEFYSMLVVGEYLYTGTLSGKLIRCNPYQKDSCKIFQTVGSSVDSLAAAGGYLYAGLGNGTILRCLHEPESCRPFHTLGSRVHSLSQVNEYIYVGLLHGNLIRCSLKTENSCIPVQNMNSKYIMGIAKTGSGVSIVTHEGEYGRLWNCTLKVNDMTDNCASERLNYKQPVGLTSFNGLMYIPTGHDDSIYACKWVDNTNCFRFGNFKNINSLAFAYRTHHLQSRYKNEDTTCTWQSGNMCPPTVTYYTAYQRALLQVHVKNGKLYNVFGSLVDTSNANRGRSGVAAIFAMSPDGRILVSNSHKRELLHTSSLFAGNPVAGAGELVVKNGVIQKMIACSDHYQPDVDLNQQVIESLRAQGYTAPISSVECEEDFELVMNEFQQR